MALISTEVLQSSRISLGEINILPSERYIFAAVFDKFSKYPPRSSGTVWVTNIPNIGIHQVSQLHFGTDFNKPIPVTPRRRWGGGVLRQMHPL